MKKVWNYVPVIVVAALVCVFATLTVRSGDSLRYAYVFPENYDDNFTRPISSISDILKSQVNHYQTINGRVTVHSIVQFFCGILPEGLFPVADAAVWILFIIIIGRLSYMDFRSFRQSVVLSCLCWLTSVGMDFDPPIQINYIWAATIVFGWLYLFKCKKNTNVFLIFTFGIVAGSCHEGLSVPVGTGLLYFIIADRKTITKSRIWGFAGFAVGALFLILAPGNFHRLSLVGGAESNIANGIEHTLPALLFPATLLAAYLLWKKRQRIHPLRIDRFSAMLLIVAAVSLLIGLFFKFRFGPRGIFTASVCFIILSLRLIRQLTTIRQGYFELFLLTVSLLWVFTGIGQLNLHGSRYREIERAETVSENGRVFIADSLIPPDYSRLADQILALSQTERAGSIHHGRLRLLPESAKPLLGLDTNMAVEFRPQAWIILQSKSNPRRFRIEKRARPTFLPFRFSPRYVFAEGSDIVVDTAGKSRIAVYVNEREYLESKIVIDNGKE